MILPRLTSAPRKLTMDNMFETGLKQRKATLGDEYVQATLDNADEFNSGRFRRP